MRYVVVLSWLLMSFSVQAENWDLLGESQVGKHYIDRGSIKWGEGKRTFSVLTNVEQADGSSWITTMGLDCTQHTFHYLNGYRRQNGQQTFKFSQPRKPETISPQSLPDQLQQAYCKADAVTKPPIAPPAPAANPPQWEVVGNSNTGEVAFDRASLRQDGVTQVFTVNTRVKPFNKQEQTMSSLSLDCAAGRFILLKAERVQEGKAEVLFDKPQPAAPFSKSATASQLAKTICTPAKRPARNPFQEDECGHILKELQALESRVQADVDGNALYCDTMQKYLEHLAEIGQVVEQNHCSITRLDQYEREIRATSCRQPDDE
ncbi:hypothetical protein LG200_03105 [Methylobacillus caricis]|uniref:surface-adhesin E family protein n=1 Tax=Methylobacillus caricis TaxID=1971611 RepID=UPI001D000016|nr:surface-adhesin E family protein [Methylobacillus caricis]MCB5186992.1 hypothetical protein [Methylobacillus caricis]